MHIRPETPKDIPAIRDVNIAAFLHHPFSHQTEHLIVEELRKAGALTVSLVAEEDDGRLLGHVAFSPATIGGKSCDWYMMGPIAVWPDVKKRGVGKGLIERGMIELVKLGAKGCVLVGDPNYYPKVGFRNAPEMTMAGVPQEVIFVRSLSSQPVPHGEIGGHKAFETGL
jgi:putative acetyltransferase